MSVRLAARLSLLPFAALALVACGGDDGGSSGGGGGDAAELSVEEQEFVDGAMEQFDAEEEDSLAEDDARCMTVSMVQELGTDRLEELGITPESFAADSEFPSLEAEEAEAIVTRIEGCMDLRAVVLSGLQDEEMSAEDQECIEDAVDDDLVHDLMVSSIQGESDEAAVGDEFFDAIGECIGMADLN